MINVGIAGASGYTGVELVKLISNHPEADLKVVTSNSYTGQSLTQIFPAMAGFESLVCRDLDISSLSNEVDVMFLALPHKVSMTHAPELIARNIKVIDLSADYRFEDPDLYEAAYQKHTSKDLLNESVYGLCELYEEKIKSARIIGNPGCYPTSILLPLVPLLKQGLISTQGIISDSKSGVSGAGRSLSLTTHFSEVNESFSAYKVGNHRHTPEINEILSLSAGQDVSLTFTPHLLPLTRGMLSTIYATVLDHVDDQMIRDTFESYYAEKSFVRILPAGRYPAISHVKNTNRCDFGYHFDEKTRQLIIISAIDNLLKGAAGQAVQNMNILFGIPEQTGLDSVQAPL